MAPLSCLLSSVDSLCRFWILGQWGRPWHWGIGTSPDSAPWLTARANTSTSFPGALKLLPVPAGCRPSCVCVCVCVSQGCTPRMDPCLYSSWFPLPDPDTPSQPHLLVFWRFLLPILLGPCMSWTFTPLLPGLCDIICSNLGVSVALVSVRTLQPEHF